MPATQMKSLRSQSDLSETTCKSPISLKGVLAWAIGLGVVLVGISTLLHGKTGFEKTLTELTLPVQTAWLLLSGWMLHSLSLAVLRKLNRKRLLPSCLLWCLFTVCGSPILGDAGYLYLESRETCYDSESDQPLDLLVVLGGSTSQGPSRAEVGDSGDRVLLAAQLFFQGEAKRLIATGSDLPLGIGKGSTPAEQTTEIWTALGIPVSEIETLPGANTHAELQALKQRLAKVSAPPRETNKAHPRIGLLTSAWHLPRAMRLARAAGLKELVPVAADHRLRVDPRPFWNYLPSANNFLRLERCQREFMASLVNR